ncbi:MAG: hypothetical protein IH880_08375 [Candidatus Marinimicrobia bacterium]|nr:hypothetical protein [Candidatus Neomarinimicrobiota bacterium]
MKRIRLGIAIVLSVVSYNIADWVVIGISGDGIWRWLKSQDIVSQSVFTVAFTWIMLLIVPIIILYKLSGKYIKD